MLKDQIEKQRKLFENESNQTVHNNKYVTPKPLIEFLQSDVYHKFLQCLHDYCQELFRLENRQGDLEEEAKARKLDTPPVLPSEKKKLNEKAKLLANAYSWIVFSNKSINDTQMSQCHSFMQFKSKILSN